MGDALIRISRGDVVRVAADDDQSRIRNLHLVGPTRFEKTNSLDPAVIDPSLKLAQDIRFS